MLHRPAHDSTGAVKQKFVFEAENLKFSTRYEGMEWFQWELGKDTIKIWQKFGFIISPQKIKFYFKGLTIEMWFFLH